MAKLKSPGRTTEAAGMGLFRRGHAAPIDPTARSERLDLRHDDLLVMGQLIEHGADLTHPRHTLYYLYFDDRDGAARAAESARAAGFAVDVRAPSHGVTDWAVVCEKPDLVLDPDTVRANSELFEELAGSHGGTYDGWEAAVA